MAKRGKHITNYHETRKQEEARRGNPSFNLVYAMSDKISENTDRFNWIDQKYKDVESKYGIEFADGTEQPAQDDRDMPDESPSVRSAPTTNPARPRAQRLAYFKSSNTLVIQFRDGTWIEYLQEVPEEMWQDLKVTDSTGKYLSGSGIDGLPWQKFDAGRLPEEVQVLFS